MSTNDQDAPPEQPTPAEALPADGAARRRFAKAASLGAGGVLMTLSSQRGMATAICASPSQSLSKWQSGHPGKTRACDGRSPGYWKNTDDWPPSVNKLTTLFSSVFKPAPGQYGTILLDTILDPQMFDTYNIGMHFAATYLNIKAGLISFLTVQDIKDMWYEYQTTMQYKPNAGVTWSGEDLVSYLKGTMS